MALQTPTTTGFELLNNNLLNLLLHDSSNFFDGHLHGERIFVLILIASYCYGEEFSYRCTQWSDEDRLMLQDVTKF